MKIIKSIQLIFLCIQELILTLSSTSEVSISLS